MGAELRRVASLAPHEILRTHTWATEAQSSQTWKEKAAASMRIPKFAFALILLALAGLGSGLAIVKAQSKAQAQVLVFTLDLPKSESLHGAFYLHGDPKNQGLSFMTGTTKPLGILKGSLRKLAIDGTRLKIGARFQFYPGTSQMTMDYDDVATETEKEYEFLPGKPLPLEIDGVGKAELRGELQDYMPVFSSADEGLAPAPGQFRILSPLVLHGGDIILDSADAKLSGPQKGMGCVIYNPGKGRLIIAPEPFASSVSGRVHESRVQFEVNGQKYELRTGAPITRAQTVWLRMDPNFRPSQESPDADDQAAFYGNFKLDELK
jgi:hypothetical protein